MDYFTFVLNDHELNHLKEIYHEHLQTFENEHVFFVATHNNIEITAYKSGKTLLRGYSLRNEIVFIKQVLKRKDFEAIGSDEVGTGDLFGPIVVCAAYASIEDIEFLESINVRDTKSVNDAYIIKYGPIIAKKLTHSLIILNPKKYNTLVEEGYNLNKIKALLHNQAIISLTSKVDNKHAIVIIDQFCLPSLYFNYLKDKTLVYRDIQFFTKAENVHIAVAAAAIIARYAFLVSLQKLGSLYDLKVVKGAAKNADDLLQDFIKKHGEKKINLIAKTNFKNVSKLNL